MKIDKTKEGMVEDEWVRREEGMEREKYTLAGFDFSPHYTWAVSLICYKERRN